MVRLLIKFVALLDRSELKPYPRSGPLFHRWLPDGLNDSIVLVDEPNQASIELWFDRQGYVDHGLIKFAFDEHEVDPDLMARQAVLEAAPLRGILTLPIDRVTGQSLDTVRRGEIGHELYVALGKRIVNILDHHISKFLDIIRINYGQYWIRDLAKWDSRNQSLGQHCSTLNLQWSLDGGSTWTEFLPNRRKSSMTLDVSVNAMSYLITEDDWSEVRDAAIGGYNPSPAAVVLSRSHELLDQGALKYALIEGVTALELAISEFTRMKLPSEEKLKPLVSRISDLPISAKAVWILSLLGEINPEELEITVRAIESRNKVVHEGEDLSEKSADMVQILQKAVASLLPGPPIRFPKMFPGNQVSPPLSTA